ncbi:hypothetical protein VTO42DRAFT_8283 [Malbranchea cinnamomea]
MHNTSPSLRQLTAVLAVAGAVSPLTAVAAASNSIVPVRAPIHLNLTGHIPADDVLKFVYADFEVPEGTTSISVLQKYSNKEKGNALDLGCWDQRSRDLAGLNDFTVGFRGWSGGARNNFTITPGGASPGYIAGSIEPGTWSVLLGPYKSVAEGIDYELNVELGFEPVTSFFEESFAPSRIESDERDGPGRNFQPTVYDDRDRLVWYRGDFHVHTVYSDGKQTPQTVVGLAQAANLSFFFSTDHNTQSSNLIWGTVAPEDMLIGRGIEVTTRAGHWNALGLNWNDWVEFRYGKNDDAVHGAAVTKVQKHDGLAIINHPFTWKDCLACDWGFSYDNMDGIEVWNGPWDESDENAVKKWHELLVDGRKIVAIGGSDYHDSPSVVGVPTTVVGSTALSTASILDGLRASRAYLVRDSKIDIRFTVQRLLHGDVAEIGDRVKRNMGLTPLLATLEIEGLPKGSRVKFISNKGTIHEERIRSDRPRKLQTKIGKHVRFTRVEVRDQDGSMQALTNPIWIE